MEILGGMFVKLVLSPNSRGESRESCQMVYGVVGVEELIICESALYDLGLSDMIMDVKGKRECGKKGAEARAMVVTKKSLMKGMLMQRRSLQQN